MMFFWLIILLVLFYLLFKNDSLSINKSRKAQDILDERFAKGEISTEDYKRMKKQMKENE